MSEELTDWQEYQLLSSIIIDLMDCDSHLRTNIKYDPICDRLRRRLDDLWLKQGVGYYEDKESIATRSTGTS